MKKWRFYIFAACLFSIKAIAGYTGNIESKVLWVKIYNNDKIYFRLKNQPSNICGYGFFVLSPSLTEDQRNRYFSMLMAAKAQGTPVTVGYDSKSTDCYSNARLVYALQAY